MNESELKKIAETKHHDLETQILDENTVPALRISWPQCFGARRNGDLDGPADISFPLTKRGIDVWRRRLQSLGCEAVIVIHADGTDLRSSLYLPDSVGKGTLVSTYDPDLQKFTNAQWIEENLKLCFSWA